MDSFKGSVGSLVAGHAVRDGVIDAHPDAAVVVLPLADGGEGTIDAVATTTDGEEVWTSTVDAVGRPLRAAHLLLPDGTHLVESARTIGLGRAGPAGAVGADLPPRASSAGLGAQLAHAVSLGATRVQIGLGGTATTDGGTGMLAALGARLDPRAEVGVNPLWHSPRLVGPLPDLGAVELVALSDVDSPLLGPHGAARLFGPQKGAGPDQVRHLEHAMESWALELGHAAGRDVARTPGAGAAGGIGAALLALGARLVPGAATVAELVGLASAVREADVVITGEGRIDAQTARGKGPAAVARAGRSAGCRVVALAGRVSADAPLDLFDTCLAIHPPGLPDGVALDAGTTLAALRRAAAEALAEGRS